MRENTDQNNSEYGHFYRVINVVEQTYIPKFSKRDDMRIPLRLFESLFDDALIDIIVGYTKLYGHTQKADTSLENF